MHPGSAKNRYLYYVAVKKSGTKICTDICQLDIKSKIILGVDLLHRARISIKSNGRQFALIAHMLKENGLKSRVTLQQHVWSKDIELDGESFQSNATTGMIANSKLFFYCDAQVKN